jgi:hypothetical protein
MVPAPRPSVEMIKRLSSAPRAPAGTRPIADRATVRAVELRNDEPVIELFTEILRRTHLSAPSDLADVVADQAGAIGARDVDLYLVNYELDALVPVPRAGGDGRTPLSIVGTVPGRGFATTSIVQVPLPDGDGHRLWLPLIDGTERLGVLGLSFDEGPLAEPLLGVCERYAHLVAMLVVSKSAYGDVFEIVRRSERMTLASELVWSLAPPLVFATDRLVVAGMLEPAYDNGGDALDYALDDGTLHLGVFDAMGHGLPAAGVAAFAIAAYRHSRRSGLGLVETYRAMHAAVGEQYPDERYVTAVIARLELETGRLTWIAAGHPPPLVLRDGRRARALATTPALPLGMPLDGPEPVVCEEALEPGDLVVLYTDGLTEARDGEGRRLGVDGLSAFIEREAASGHPAPETLRRLRQVVVGGSGRELKDDATALLVEWNRGGERALLPQTVG